MLSQDDRRRLAAIEHQLELEDPGFAEALRVGRPRRPAGDRRWPLIVAITAGALVCLIGLLAQAVVLVLLGGATGVGAGIALYVHMRRVQGRPPRRGPDWPERPDRPEAVT